MANPVAQLNDIAFETLMHDPYPSFERIRSLSGSTNGWVFRGPTSLPVVWDV